MFIIASGGREVEKGDSNCSQAVTEVQSNKDDLANVIIVSM